MQPVVLATWKFGEIAARAALPLLTSSRSALDAALAGAQAVAQANEGGRRIGFANPLIYFLARIPGEFYDVTPQGDLGNVRSDFINGQNGDDGIRYTVRTFNQDSSLSVAPGWDDVTGVGVPKASWLTSFGS